MESPNYVTENKYFVTFVRAWYLLHSHIHRASPMKTTYKASLVRFVATFSPWETDPFIIEIGMHPYICWAKPVYDQGKNQT